MATWTENEVNTIVDHFKGRLDMIRTGVDLENFINGINKGKVKTFLKDKLQQGADNDRASKDVMEEKALEKEALKDKIDKL